MEEHTYYIALNSAVSDANGSIHLSLKNFNVAQILVIQKSLYSGPQPPPGAGEATFI